MGGEQGMVTTEQQAPGRATIAQRWLARLALVAAAAAVLVPLAAAGFNTEPGPGPGRGGWLASAALGRDPGPEEDARPRRPAAPAAVPDHEPALAGPTTQPPLRHPGGGGRRDPARPPGGGGGDRGEAGGGGGTRGWPARGPQEGWGARPLGGEAQSPGSGAGAGGKRLPGDGRDGGERAIEAGSAGGRWRPHKGLLGGLAGGEEGLDAQPAQGGPVGGGFARDGRARGAVGAAAERVRVPGERAGVAYKNHDGLETPPADGPDRAGYRP